MIRPILLYGSKILKQTSRSLATNQNYDTLCVDMEETLKSIPEAVGLSAVQVGSLDRVIATKTENGEIQFYINPIIQSVSEETGIKKESCLSLPNISVAVERPISITLSYMDKNHEISVIEVNGDLARIIQHEIDHLNGILIIDRTSPAQRMMMDGKLKQIKRQNVYPRYFSVVYQYDWKQLRLEIMKYDNDGSVSKMLSYEEIQDEPLNLESELSSEVL